MLFVDSFVSIKLMWYCTVWQASNAAYVQRVWCSNWRDQSHSATRQQKRKEVSSSLCVIIIVAQDELNIVRDRRNLLDALFLLYYA